MSPDARAGWVGVGWGAGPDARVLGGKDMQGCGAGKSSRHSNAFFTGFGRFRKIVLFDTLIEQLSEPELEAVLAHEIRHYKKKHIPKMLAWAAGTLLVGFFLLACLAPQNWVYRAFGF